MMKAKHLTEGSAETLYHFAYMQYKQGKYQEATGLFRLLTVSNPKNKKYWMGLGASLQMEKEYDQAIAAYELAVAIDPSDPLVHLQAADCFFAQEKQKEGLFALDCAERALQQLPEKDKNLMSRIDWMRQAWKKESR